MQMISSLPRPGWSLLASQRPSSTRSSRRLLLRPAAQANNSSDNERNNYNVRKGKQFENKRRRRGRPAHLRSPYDSPLRDGNRDRLIGLLTERAAKTLMVYLMETNANVYSWLVEFYKANPIPKNGNWDEVSGEAFLRKLLSMPIEEAKFNTGRDSLFDNVRSCGVDPRSIAQRIMDIRTQLSEEFIQELQAIAEENSVLLRETLQTSLSSSLPSLDDPAAAAAAAAGSSDAPVHPELAETTTSSSSSSSSAATEDKGSKSSSKDGSVSTPPPSPVPDTPTPKAEPIKGASSSSSSKASSDAADKAAAVAALNAALNKPPAAGSGSGNSSTSSSGSSEEEKVNMSEVLAQLRRAMEADVARDVLKMKESTAAPESPPGSDGSSSAATAASSSEQQQEAADAPSGLPEAAGDSLNPTTGAAAVEEAPAQEEQAPTPTLAPAAEAAATAADGAQADTDAEAAAGSAEAAAGGQGPTGSALVGEAGTYSLMLPKGWGPRLGVGFSRYPRSRNNIVSSASLGSLKPGAAAAGDALSGAAGEAV